MTASKSNLVALFMLARLLPMKRSMLTSIWLGGSSFLLWCGSRFQDQVLQLLQGKDKSTFEKLPYFSLSVDFFDLYHFGGRVFILHLLLLRGPATEPENSKDSRLVPSTDWNRCHFDQFLANVGKHHHSYSIISPRVYALQEWGLEP